MENTESEDIHSEDNLKKIENKSHQIQNQEKPSTTSSLKCAHCTSHFATKDFLALHVRECHPSHDCYNCDKSFKNRSLLKVHHEKEHPNLPRHQCPICKKGYYKKYYLDEHMVIRHETKDKTFFCEQCKKGFSLELNYKRHLDLHKEEDEKPLVCGICDSRFPDQAGLDKHAASHNPRRVQCDICSQFYFNADSLAIHRRTHTGEKPVKCDQCEEKFMDRHAKRYHMLKVHSPPDQHHLCTICGKTFFYLKNFKYHVARHEGTFKFKTPMLSCDQCEEKFRGKRTLQSHKIEKHGADPFVCDECDATFRTTNSLAMHKRGHFGEKPHKCDICDARFLVNSLLTQHMRKHTGERPFECEHCGLKFMYQQNWAGHIKKFHTEGYVPPTPHACSYPGCGRTFECKSYVDSHFRQAHTTERPFVCEVCNTGFASKPFLNRHTKTVHNNGAPAKPLICNECGEEFKTVGSRAHHKSVHHKKGEQKQHKCDKCDAVYNYNQLLTTHMKTVHSHLTYPCSNCEAKFNSKRYLSKHIKNKHTEGYVRPTPYACSYSGCERKFENNSKLKEHIRRAHTMEKPFVCDVCNRGFPARNNLMKHKKTCVKV